MKFFPLSLFGRLLTGLLSIIGATILIVAVLIVRDRREIVSWGDGRAEAITQIREITHAIESTPIDERHATVAALALQLRQARAEEAPAVPPPGRNFNLITETYARRIERVLGSDYDVSISRSRRNVGALIELNGSRRPGRDAVSPQQDGPPGRRGMDRPGGGGPRGLDIEVTLPDGYRVAFRTDVPRSPPPGRNVIFLELALLTIALIAALFFVTRAITRPLSELAQAAEGVGRGHSASALPERGAREIRETTRAFNAMRERLQRYLDSRADTLAAMSHDLRTPLTRLRLRLEKISDDDLRMRCSQDLEEMNDLIAGTLAFFRTLSDDGNESEPEQIDVNDLCSEIRDQFAETGHDFTVEGSASHLITARRQAIKRCLSNLIANAVRFAENVSVQIEDADNVVIRVRDDGPGIPPEELENVFRPFYRVDSSRNSESGGAGLGLTIARDIAQSLGGTLTLRNRSPGLEAELRLPHSVR
ncbi:MAG: ATP-binding protein [Gammaproteobacteria bacterium]|jgi:signal transduction histidine kinase